MLAAGCLAPPDQAADTHTTVNVCRYVLSELPATMALFDLNLAARGSTCFTGTESLLFLPSKTGSCRAPEGIQTKSAVAIGANAADAELRGCFASARAEPLRGTDSITYTGLVDDADLVQFGMDTNALAAADGLPITRIIFDETRVCVETNRPDVVDQRIRAADIINFAYVGTTYSKAHCAAV